ncbi:MAG: 30S ribosomal protein S3 [Kiritimatiellia bacterium]
MGQKVNPIGLRVAVTKEWRSRWFASKKVFGSLLIEDEEIRTIIKSRLKEAAVAEILIERYANRVRVSIFTARPGVVIGRKGADLEVIRTDLTKQMGKDFYIEIREVRNPDANAQLVAESIALQLERRVSFRRALKRAIKMAMDLGVDGIKVRVSGRLGGSELSRSEWYKEGRVPLHTLRANIEYGFTEARTTAGAIGVKVWICRPKVEADKEPRGKSHGAYA